MAPAALSFQAYIVPSRAQAALAIAIVQSKPSGTPVREYVLRLRAQMRRGQNPFHAQDQGHYLDLVAYWQDQFRQAQDECERLRSINIKLERSNQMLTSRTSATLDPDAINQGPKRKARTAAPARAPKRTRQRNAQQTVADTQEAIEDDSDFLDGLGEDGANLTEALFITHNLCRASDVDADGLCFSLVRTSSALGKVICTIARNHEQLSRQGRRTPGAISLDQDKSDFAVALSTCARAFMSILVGMNRLMDSNSDKRLASLIVCELAEMFKSALNSIASSARQTAQLAPPQTEQSKKGKAKGPVNVVKESVPARAIAHLLISFLGFLEKTDSVHQNIFDGFVFVLFERVGKRLYYCTFGRHRSATIEGNITPIPEPTNAVDIATREAEALAIRLEIKALVLILERAMGLAPNHMNPQTNRANKTPNRLARTLSLKTLPAASRARLSPLAKDRLQRTLITCMYGNKADDEFLDVLTKPMPAIRLGSLQNVAKVDDKDVEDWYKQEVWRLVGWDVLARESAW